MSTRTRRRKWPRPTTDSASDDHACPAAAGRSPEPPSRIGSTSKDKGNIETTAEEGKVEFRKTEEFRKKQEE